MPIPERGTKTLRHLSRYTCYLYNVHYVKSMLIMTERMAAWGSRSYQQFSFGSHAFKRRRSQSLAVTQSRLTVAVEMDIAAAVSSIERPPK